MLAGEIPGAHAFRGTLRRWSGAPRARAGTRRPRKPGRSSGVVYAGLAADEDTRVAKSQGLVQQMTQLVAAFSAAWAFLQPRSSRWNPRPSSGSWLRRRPRALPAVPPRGDAPEAATPAARRKSS